MTTIDSIAKTLKTADDWRAKGQPAWEARCLSSALLGYLSIAVIQKEDLISGLSWLQSQEYSKLLTRHLSGLEQLGHEVTEGRLPSSVIAGNYHPLVFAHVAWCLNEISLGESFASFSGRRDVTELSTPFWREYARGVAALKTGEAFQYNLAKLRGQEKYWVRYLELIQTFLSGKSIEPALKEIDYSFSDRNADKKLTDDSYEIEGSGIRPVKWDFRRAGLLTYFKTRAGSQP